MESRVGKWRGSLAIRLPEAAVESLCLTEGEAETLEFERGGLMIRPARCGYRLEDLVEEAKSLTPPKPVHDTPVGDELL